MDVDVWVERVELALVDVEVLVAKVADEDGFGAMPGELMNRRATDA